MLFGLEELDTFAFSNENDVMWRGFVTSVIAAVSLQYIDPFGTSKLVLFQVSGVSDTWRAFELVSRPAVFWEETSVQLALLVDTMAIVGCHWCKVLRIANIPPRADKVFRASSVLY